MAPTCAQLGLNLGAKQAPLEASWVYRAQLGLCICCGSWAQDRLNVGNPQSKPQKVGDSNKNASFQRLAEGLQNWPVLGPAWPRAAPQRPNSAPLGPKSVCAISDPSQAQVGEKGRFEDFGSDQPCGPHLAPTPNLGNKLARFGATSAQAFGRCWADMQLLRTFAKYLTVCALFGGLSRAHMAPP